MLYGIYLFTIFKWILNTYSPFFFLICCFSFVKKWNCSCLSHIGSPFFESILFVILYPVFVLCTRVVKYISQTMLLFTPFSVTRFAMHRIYADRINSRGMSRVFCDLRSQKTPRGTLPVNSNHFGALFLHKPCLFYNKRVQKSPFFFGFGKNPQSFRNLPILSFFPSVSTVIAPFFMVYST